VHTLVIDINEQNNPEVTGEKSIGTADKFLSADGIELALRESTAGDAEGVEDGDLFVDDDKLRAEQIVFGAQQCADINKELNTDEKQEQTKE